MRSRGSSRVGILCIAVVGMVSACAPTYRPPAPFIPMHEGQGDSQLAVYLGTGGGQVNFGYALTDVIALRASGQVATGDLGNYAVAGVGADLYGASQSLRYGLAVEGSSGPSVGESVFNVNGDESNLRFAGTVFNGRLVPYFGVEVTGFGVNLSIANVYSVIQHNATSDGDGTGRIAMLEPNVVMRAGARQVSFEAFAGIALPYAADGDVGVPVPINIGAGMTFQLTRGEPEE